eukprot:jgi/Pico_ML_1/51491/g2515.t2
MDPNLVPGGKLAVVYDKNLMEASGYAAALADLMQEEVILAPFLDLKEADGRTKARFCDGVLQRLGGFACIKIPYSNAGQGVYTITSDLELEAFVSQQRNCPYEKFVVQSLIGNADWSSTHETGEKLYHDASAGAQRRSRVVARMRCAMAMPMSVQWRHGIQ